MQILKIIKFRSEVNPCLYKAPIKLRSTELLRPRERPSSFSMSHKPVFCTALAQVQLWVLPPQPSAVTGSRGFVFVTVLITAMPCPLLSDSFPQLWIPFSFWNGLRRCSDPALHKVLYSSIRLRQQILLKAWDSSPCIPHAMFTPAEGTRESIRTLSM